MVRSYAVPILSTNMVFLMDRNGLKLVESFMLKEIGKSTTFV